MAGRLRIGSGRLWLDKSFYVALVVLATTVLAQATLVVRVRSLGATPNLLLVVVVTWSLLNGGSTGIAWAFAGGLLFDLIAALPLGTSSLALVTICYLAGLWEGTLFQGSVFLPLIAVALATPVYGLIASMCQLLHVAPVDWRLAMLKTVLPEMALNVAAAVAVYPALRLLSRRVGAEHLNW